jgi:hypothetical protein
VIQTYYLFRPKTEGPGQVILLFHFTFIRMIRKLGFLHLFLFSLFSFHPGTARAQAVAFHAYLDTIGLIYTPPSGYSPIDYHGNFVFSGGHYTSEIFYAIKNNTSDIVIGFILKPMFRTDTASLTYRVFHYDPNTAWLKDIKNQADPSASPPLFYDKMKMSRINADSAAFYQLKMENAFLNDYTHCKILEIHKEHTGDAEICYFYNDKTSNLVDKEIKATYGVLTYKSD